MNLDDAQRKRVAEWIAQGLKLSEIQKRLGSELGVVLTYMDVRLLVDDLRLTPKDIDPPKPTPPMTAPASALSAQAPTIGGVSVRVDQIARAGTIVSGKVTFSDGMLANWHLDQSGKIGLAAEQAGYRPPASDVQQFQTALDAELSKMGF